MKKVICCILRDYPSHITVLFVQPTQSDKDWWNSTEVSAYWRLWNLPVHYWLIRHLYFPCLRFNMSKTMATFIVFFFSAVMHELLISVPFRECPYRMKNLLLPMIQCTFSPFLLVFSFNFRHVETLELPGDDGTTSACDDNQETGPEISWKLYGQHSLLGFLLCCGTANGHPFVHN